MVEGISVTEGDNYGTREKPLTAAQAEALIAKLCPNDGDMTEELIYLYGVVTDAGTWNDKNSYFSNVKVSTGSGDLLIYSLNLETGLTKNDLQVGKVIKLFGYGKNYKGTFEIDKLDLDNKAYVYSIEDKIITSFDIGGDFSKKSYGKNGTWKVDGLTFTGHTDFGDVTLSADEFDFSFNPATPNDTSITSVTVTATYKQNTTITASKVINGITVTEAPATEKCFVTDTDSDSI